MDIRYLMQLFLLIIFFITIQYVTLYHSTRVYGFLNLILKEECHYIYNRFSKHIEKKNIYAFEKYEMWRYIERHRESSFIANK